MSTGGGHGAPVLSAAAFCTAGGSFDPCCTAGRSVRGPALGLSMIYGTSKQSGGCFLEGVSART